MALTEEEKATYRTLIDAAQQAPGALSLSQMELSGRKVAVIGIDMNLKTGGTDLLPLALILDDDTVAMLRYHGKEPGVQSPSDYE